MNFRPLSLALLLGTVWSAAAAEPSLSPKVADRLKKLESHLSQVQTLKVDFVQTKEMAILEQKLTLTGRITLQQPDKLAWRVHTPIRYGMAIEGTSFKQWSDDTQSVQKFSLAGNPVFATAVKQIRSWFAGNYLELAREFDVTILSDSPLAAQFTPRNGSPAAEVIRKIVMRFGSDERYLKSLEVEEAGGDRMQLEFVKTQLNPSLDKEEWDPRHE